MLAFSRGSRIGPDAPRRPLLARRAPARVLAASTVALALAVTLVGGPTSPSVAAPGQQSASSALAATTLAARPQNKRSKSYKPPEGAVFNIARGGAAQYRIEQQIIRAIDKARPNTFIKMSMFSYDRMPVTDALIRARKRKVKVQVLTNNHELPAAQARLRSVLHQNRKLKSWFFQCAASCRGQGDVNHSKFILFSQTGAAKDVVMVGSPNMKQNGTDNQFNDLYTDNDNAPLHDFYDGIFKQMARDRLAKPAYVKRNFGSRFQVHILPFPRDGAATKATRYTVARDPIVQLLAPIRCLGAKGNPGGRTIVRVDMHAWDGERGAMLANKFRDLYAKGCDVRIMVGFAGQKVREIFARRTGRGYVPIRSTGFDTDGDRQIDLYSHAKVMTVKGHYGDRRSDRFIVTGSSNYQNGGQYGDEVVMRVRGGSIYNAYNGHWNYMWSNHTHGFSFSPRSARRAGPPMLYDGLGTDSPEWQDE